MTKCLERLRFKHREPSKMSQGLITAGLLPSYEQNLGFFSVYLGSGVNLEAVISKSNIFI